MGYIKKLVTKYGKKLHIVERENIFFRDSLSNCVSFEKELIKCFHEKLEDFFNYLKYFCLYRQMNTFLHHSEIVIFNPSPNGQFHYKR